MRYNLDVDCKCFIEYCQFEDLSRKVRKEMKENTPKSSEDFFGCGVVRKLRQLIKIEYIFLLSEFNGSKTYVLHKHQLPY